MGKRWVIRIAVVKEKESRVPTDGRVEIIVETGKSPVVVEKKHPLDLRPPDLRAVD